MSAMPVSSSSVERVLQSPFSHSELYGIKHPLVIQHQSQTKKTAKKTRRTQSGDKIPHSKSISGNRLGDKNVTAASRINSRTDCRLSAIGGSRNRMSSGNGTKYSMSSGCSRISASTKDIIGDRSKDVILTEGSCPTISSQTHSNHPRHQSTHLTSFQLPSVEANSPQVTKKTINKHSFSPLHSASHTSTGNTSSSSNHNKWKVKGAWMSGESSIIKPITGRESKEFIAKSRTSTPLSLQSETDSISSIHTTTACNKRLPGSTQAPVSFSRWSKSSSTHTSQHLLGSGIPHRTLTSTSASRWWSRGRGVGQRRQLELKDIAMGMGRMKYKHIIVMSGAGISTPSGIPDFRTPGTGLYDNLQKYNLPEPSAVFDTVYFNHNPRPFFSLAKELYPGKFSPNLVHCFVRLLQDKGVLLRNYTQNIDGLERLAGVKEGRLVEAHGSFSTASCIRCHSKQDTEEVKEAIFNGIIPKCKHKYCNGVVKPDIVFFGEDLPQRFHSLQLPDFSKCDLLLVMGTSLEVEPFASLVTLSRHTVPRLLLNRELVGPFQSSKRRLTDVTAGGDIVDNVKVLVEEAGWWKELEEIQRLVSKETGLCAVTQPVAYISSSSSHNDKECPLLTPALERLTIKDITHPLPSDHTSLSSSSSSSSSSSLSASSVASLSSVSSSSDTD